MEILVKAFAALWQVLLVGLLLGVGLPALFALGVRSLNSNRVLVSSAFWSSSMASNCSGSEPDAAAFFALVLDICHRLAKGGLPERDSRAGLRAVDCSARPAA